MNATKQYYQLIEESFAKLAPYYDLVCFPISGLRERVADLLPSNPPLRILDVATGTGAQAFAFAKRGHYVIGSDLSEAMLQIARRKRKADNLLFELGDASKLPYPNQSFDVTCVSFALHDMLPEIREKAVSEMLRVTKAQGKILIVDYRLPKNRFWKSLVYRLVHLYEGPYYTDFINSNLRGWLEQKGIAILDDFSALFGTARIISGIKRES